jgi:hypothetical protein
MLAIQKYHKQASGRGGQDRTGDLFVPNEARYRCATPRFDVLYDDRQYQKNGYYDILSPPRTQPI